MNKSFEFVKCILCQKDDSALLFEKNSFKIVKCRGCGLIYVNPRYEDDKVRQLYEFNELDYFNYFLRNQEADTKTFEKRLDLIESYKNKGKLLDVGCAIGLLLEVAKKRGWDCIGIELARKATDYCKKRGLNVLNCRLEEADFDDNFFDVITLADVIEHVKDPVETLNVIRKKIREDGLLFLTTPDIGSLHARILGKHWLQVKPKEHIYYFSPKTITQLLEKTGFEVILCKHAGNFRNLKTVIEKTSVYSKILYYILSFIFPDKVSEKIYFNLNPFDEMLVLARPKK